MKNIILKSKESGKQITINAEFIESMEPDFYWKLNGFDYDRIPCDGTQIVTSSGKEITVFETIKVIKDLISKV